MLVFNTSSFVSDVKREKVSIKYKQTAPPPPPHPTPLARSLVVALLALLALLTVDAGWKVQRGTNLWWPLVTWLHRLERLKPPSVREREAGRNCVKAQENVRLAPVGLCARLAELDSGRASARVRHYLQSEHLSECINQDKWKGGALTSRPPSGQHAAHTHTQALATSCCLLTELPSPHPRPEARGGDPIHCRVDTTCQGRDPAPHISRDVTNVPPSTQVPKVLSFFTCILLK